MNVTTIRPRRMTSDRPAPSHRREPYDAAAALNLIGDYLRTFDPAAVILLDGELLTPTGLYGAAVDAQGGSIPRGLTVTVTHVDHQDCLAALLKAPTLEHIGGAVAGPGGMKVLIRLPDAP